MSTGTYTDLINELRHELRRVQDEREALRAEQNRWYDIAGAERVHRVAAEAERDRYRAALEQVRRSHTVCDDCWYSCPASGECCRSGARGCDCGADAANAVIDAALEPQP